MACFGTACDVATSFCCLRVEDSAPACAPASDACFHAASTFECLSAADCAGQLDGKPVAGDCCAVITTVSPAPDFADAGAGETTIRTTCALGSACPAGSLPTCAVVNAPCGTNGGVAPGCQSLTVGTTKQVDTVLWRDTKKLLYNHGVCVACKEDPKWRDRPRPCEHSAIIPEIPGELARTGLKSADFREITGYTASEAEAIAGVSGSRLLYLIDEPLARQLLLAIPDRSPRTGAFCRPLFVVLWETGLRPKTVVRLEVPLHYRRGQDHLFISREIDKEGFERTIPLTDEAREALDRACPDKPGLIFPWKVCSLRDVLALAAERVGVTELGLTPYDFRHSRTTAGANSPGAALTGIAHLVGHKHVSTTALYIQTSEAAARAALDAMKRNKVKL